MKITITKLLPELDLNAMKIEQVRDLASSEWRYMIVLTDGDVLEAQNEMELQGRKLTELPEYGLRPSDILRNLYRVAVAIEDAYSRKKDAEKPTE